ncbi:putative P450 monooxygenase [Aureobasidium pullulans]|nr:putative P450 monooxygenase [Aureobasidium pullulans]
MEPIPQPAGLPFLGNVLSIDAAHPQESLAKIAQLYGPIFKLKIGAERIFVASHELAKDLFDEEKFEKAVAGPLKEIRHGVKDGLFTAQPGEHNWEIAHRILMPAFGPLSIESMFNEMADVASQLVLKWARFGPHSAIDVTDDFTRLTLDSIALCAMGDRFNSFYHDDMHPFVKAMLGLLTGAGARARRPGFAPEMLYSKSNQQFHDDIDELQTVAKQLLDERRKHLPHESRHKQHDTAETDPNAAPLLVLYGSNTGTCEALAQSLSSSAARHGYKAKVATMDSLASGMPKDIPAVIITASYEGQPPDNASHFCNWLEKADRKELKGVRYSVFGVGNKEWASTYQRIPTVVDSTLAEKGAERLADRFAADVTDGSVFDKFDKWQDEQFWPAVSKAFGEKGSSVEQSQSDASELKVEVDLQSRSNLLRQNMQVAEVRDTRLLTKPGAPRKRHIALNLPTGLTYKTGDYLAVLPHNPIENVCRVMRRLRLPWDATLKIEEGSATSLPTGIAIPVYDILSGMVELAQPATSRAVQMIAKTIPEEAASKELANRAGDESFQKNNISVLDILEEYPTAEFSIGQFLGAVPPMRVRQYSISSSPLEKENVASLTWSVIDAPAKGRGEGRHFEGVSSNFLERLSPGDRVQISHRASRTGFGLPKDNESPIIMACAGTGLAPFRAFVAERALKKAAGKKVGAALLFYGLNAPDEDDMYREEFDAWEKAGVVDVRRAFTHASEKSCGARFVQDRIWHDRKDAIEMFKQNASLYLCGAGVVGTGIAEVMKKIRMEYHGGSEEEAAEWVSKLKGERYWADVFA